MIQCSMNVVTCQRHKWKVVGEVSIPFPAPGGGNSGLVRPWQTLECQACPERLGRWKPGTKPYRK